LHSHCKGRWSDPSRTHLETGRCVLTPAFIGGFIEQVPHSPGPYFFPLEVNMTKTVPFRLACWFCEAVVRKPSPEVALSECPTCGKHGLLSDEAALCQRALPDPNAMLSCEVCGFFGMASAFIVSENGVSCPSCGSRDCVPFSEERDLCTRCHEFLRVPGEEWCRGCCDALGRDFRLRFFQWTRVLSLFPW